MGTIENIVKRKVVLEDFVNRYCNSDNTPSLWGTIIDDIVINENDSDPIYSMGLHLIKVSEEVTDVYEYDDAVLSVDNINKYYKKDEVIYQLAYVNILSLVEVVEEIENNNETIESITQIMKSKTLFRYYNLLNKLRSNLTIYKKCVDGYYEIGDDGFYDVLYENIYNNDKIELNGVECNLNNLIFVDNIPSIESGYELIGVSKYSNDFNRIFRLNNKKRYEKDLWNIANNILDGKYKGERYKPFMDMPLYIEGEINSMGMFEDSLNMWKPNKDYYVNDIVSYTDENNTTNTYKLKYGNKIEYVEISGELYKELALVYYKFYSIAYSISNFETNILKDKTKYDESLLKNDGKRYIIVESNKIYVPYFTCSEEPSNSEYWEIYNGDIDNNPINGDGEYEVSAVLESKLSNVRNFKKTTDENGNVLPFNISDNSINAEIPYKVGVSNIYMSNTEDGFIYADVIDEIVLSYKEKNNENSEEITKVVTGHTNTLTCEGLNEGSGTIKFTYRIGAIVDGNSVLENSGIKYEDVYPCSVVTESFAFIPDGNGNIEYSLIDVEYEDGLNVEDAEYSNTENKKENIGKIYKIGDVNNGYKYYQLGIKIKYVKIDYSNNISSVSYGGKMISDDNFFNINIIKPSYLDEIEDCTKSVNVTLERGISAAFERHHILSEVNTFQDLENYRNNYFKL